MSCVPCAFQVGDLVRILNQPAALAGPYRVDDVQFRTDGPRGEPPGWVVYYQRPAGGPRCCGTCGARN